MVRNGKPITLGFYVYDNLVTCKLEENLQWFLGEMKKKLLDVKVQENFIKTFLGILIDTTQKNKITLCMNQLTKECLDGIFDEASTPALDNLFISKEGSLPLIKSQREQVHSKVAKLRYLAENTRPDFNLAASFLSTKFTAPTEDDAVKLHRILFYLNKTRDFKLVIDASPFGE